MSFQPKSAYDYDELIHCANGELFGLGNARLPYPPMLMFDEISEINNHGGAFNKGQIVAKLHVKPDLWFFHCHFKTDPVMPGCLGLDAMWQLIGFFLGWGGSPGRGRALGVGEVKFFGQILPEVKQVRYEIDMKRVIRGKLHMGIGDGKLFADDKQIYSAETLKVGAFVDLSNL